MMMDHGVVWVGGWCDTRVLPSWVWPLCFVAHPPFFWGGGGRGKCVFSAAFMHVSICMHHQPLPFTLPYLTLHLSFDLSLSLHFNMKTTVRRPAPRDPDHPGAYKKLEKARDPAIKNIRRA
jgi:hypothetical protein